MLHSLPVDGTVVVLLTLTIIYLSLKKFLFLLCHNHKLLLKRGQLKIIAEVRNANCVRVSYLQNQDFILKANHCLLLGVSCKPLCVLFENCPLAVLKFSLPEGNVPGLSSLIVLLVGHLPTTTTTTDTLHWEGIWRHVQEYKSHPGQLVRRCLFSSPAMQT